MVADQHAVLGKEERGIEVAVAGAHQQVAADEHRFRRAPARRESAAARVVRVLERDPIVEAVRPRQ